MFDPRSDAPPHPTVQKSLLFNLVANGRNRHAKVDERYFREVFSSKYVAFFLRLWHPHLILFSPCRYGLLRVYQIKDVDAKSKAWLANPRNRKCDRPGSWYCPGQYPPAVKPPPSKHRGIDYEVSSSFCPCFASSLLTLLLNRKKGIISVESCSPGEIKISSFLPHVVCLLIVFVTLLAMPWGSPLADCSEQRCTFTRP